MQTVRMEEAFDPFGLEESESALQKAPDIVSPSPEQERKNNVDHQEHQLDDDPFDPFRMSGGDPFALAATVVEQQPRKLIKISNDDAVDSDEESPTGPPTVNRIVRSAAGLPTTTSVRTAAPSPGRVRRNQVV